MMDNTSKLLIRCAEAESKQIGISFAKLRVISLLSAVNEEGATLQELSMWTFREINSVSVLIRNLENDGLVQKVITPYKVSNRYFLTEDGMKIVEQINNHTKAGQQFFGCLTEEEQANLRTYLCKLQQRGEEMLGIHNIPPFLAQ